MKNITVALTLVCLLLLFAACRNKPQKCIPQERNKSLASIDSLGIRLHWPDDLQIMAFSGPELTPSPACLAVAPTGEVYVGVDMIGSLGKTPGRGRIMKLVDCNNDGIIDRHTVFAQVNNPRGIIAMGDQLYVLHTVFSKDSVALEENLVVFEDKDHDGVADGPAKTLVKHMGNPTYLAKRGTDHATNGIRMGIDGWIYIAVGDFSLHNTIGADGTRLTMLGGGIVRVRPDGSELEIYTHGTRNIYDLAIDPFMNIFTRDNTNDGGGWNIRFSHQIQSGEYGYPVLFKHFTEEIIPALADLGGGSGTGALFMDEPTWPDKYNQVPMMADWGRSMLYIHELTPDGATFTQKQQDFIKLPQITDIDVDGSGRMYLSAWDGAGYSGDSSKGFVVRVVPKDWKFRPFPEVKEASMEQLQALLSSKSAVARLAAQQELLSRSPQKAARAGWKVASDKSLPLAARVAGMYTFAQGAGQKGIEKLVQLSSEKEMEEYALRALSDRKPFLDKVPIEPFLKGIKDTAPRIQVAAIIGLGRLARKEAIPALLRIPAPPTFKPVPKGEIGPHATPDAAIIPAHLAVHALVNLHATDACIAAIGTKNTTLALWALQYMHDPEAVDGLIQAFKNTADPDLKKEILFTLARLYQKEAPYDGSWWWGTRPDTHGPYYKPVTWESSDRIKALFMEVEAHSNNFGSAFFADLDEKYQLEIARFSGERDKSTGKKETPGIDLNKIRSKKGQIGASSIEDILLAMDKIKGDPAIGKKLFIQQGCIACHTIHKGEKLKGPYMGQIGAIMNRKQIAEAILKPNASISQGFATTQITTKDGKVYTGFVTSQSSDKVVLRDITGTPHTVKTKNIAKQKELENSIMPSGLANALSYEEFASLITYLSQQKE